MSQWATVQAAPSPSSSGGSDHLTFGRKVRGQVTVAEAGRGTRQGRRQ